MVRPDHGGDDRVHLFTQPLFECRAPFVHVDFAEVIVAGAVGKQAAGFVDDRDPLRLEPVDGGSHQVANGAHLLRLQHAVDLEHDRRRRLHLAREERAFGQYEMHACGHHAVEPPDGSRQLAFERAQIVDILNKTRRAERIRLVENLVADAASLGQALPGERHPQPCHPILGHHDGVAVVAQLVTDRLPLQLLHDRGRVLIGQIGEERCHLRRGDAQNEEGEKPH